MWVSRDCHATDALRAISVWKLKLETKWVCIQLAFSWRPTAISEEAHHWNIQAKFYNEKFPLVYEGESIRDSLYEEQGATLKHKCGKRIVTLPPFFSPFFLLFGGLLWPLLFIFKVRSLIPTCGGIIVSIILSSLGQCSNNDDHHTLFTYNSISQLDI